MTNPVDRDMRTRTGGVVPGYPPGRSIYACRNRNRVALTKRNVRPRGREESTTKEPTHAKVCFEKSSTDAATRQELIATILLLGPINTSVVDL
jgi:hypothetical protein